MNKNQITYMALEGTCSGDVVGGLLPWTGESLQALFLFERRETLGHKRSKPGEIGEETPGSNHDINPKIRRYSS